jgi:hypothetical protein
MFGLLLLLNNINVRTVRYMQLQVEQCGICGCKCLVLCLLLLLNKKGIGTMWYVWFQVEYCLVCYHYMTLKAVNAVSFYAFLAQDA